MNLAYADPPYPGCAHLYKHHEDYAGEVDHAELITRIDRDYDGWLLHTSSTALRDVLALCPPDVRVMAWVKPFAAFKRNVPVAYAWEPVIVKPARKQSVEDAVTVPLRDWIAESATLRRGLVGAKPERVCWWAFEVMGADRDESDLYPGTGAVMRAWESWRATPRLSAVAAFAQDRLEES